MVNVCQRSPGSWRYGHEGSVCESDLIIIMSYLVQRNLPCNYLVNGYRRVVLLAVMQKTNLHGQNRTYKVRDIPCV